MTENEDSEVKKGKNDVQLFLDVADKTDEAKQTFLELDECTYSSKDIGSSGQDEHMTCDCHEYWDPKTGKNMACGDDSDCINRATSVECVNKYCSCGRDCQNQRFQKKLYANVSVFQTELKGYGLKSNEVVPEGGFIYEYIGEVIDENRFRKRMIEYDQKNLKHFYFMMLKNNSFIDATMKGSLARFCNHSCNPNAFVDKWVVGDKLRMGIFAKRQILMGEEITFDYNVDRYGAQKQPCYCGEPNCIKFLGGKTQTDAALLLPDYISEALGVTHKQERQWLKENKHLRSKQQSEDVNINEAFVRSINVTELNEVDVPKVMGALMKSQDLCITKKLMERIWLTNDENVNFAIIRLHGYKTLSQVLKTFKDQDDELVYHVIQILTKWPRVTRNKISSSQIEDVVKEINANTENPEIKSASDELLEAWSKLLMAYRIPKNERNKGSPDAYSRSIRSRSKSPERNGSADPQPLEDDDTLPEGWKAAYDPNTNKNYYYHVESGISKWERPKKEIPKGPRGPKHSEKPKRNDYNNSLGYSDDLLAKREEERMKKEKEDQFKEVRQKEKLLQDLILQSQKEMEEKKQLEQKLKQEELERKKEKLAQRRKAKSESRKDSKKSSKKAVPLETQWTKTFAGVIPNLLKKYETEIGRDNVKGCAKDLVKILVEKEIKKNPNVKPPSELTSSKIKKLKDYAKIFMEKFLIKYRAKHNRKRSTPENSQENESVPEKKIKVEENS